MKDMVKNVSHEVVRKLLHNKFVVVLGDSIQRSVYKDLVLLLQKEKYLTVHQLRSKGERSFELDCLVEGGCLTQLHNGTEYKEVRQYQTDHHLVRFYFVTRIYSSYMRSILNDFRSGPKPDILIVNSCVWDISRYNSEWEKDYKEDLHNFFDSLNGVLPLESLAIWNLTMPLAKKIKGGFLVAEVQHKAPHLRSDVIEANFFGGSLADKYGLDVLDLHFQFRFSLQHRARDGVHWNAIAHRQISTLLIQHIAQAWGVTLPCPLSSEKDMKIKDGKCENPGIRHMEAPLQYPCPPYNYSSLLGPPPSFREIPRTHGYSQDFYTDSVSYEYQSFEDPLPRAPQHRAPPGPPRRAPRYDIYRPPHRNHSVEQHQYVMKSRHRHHYAPYTYHRPSYGRYDYYHYY